MSENKLTVEIESITVRLGEQDFTVKTAGFMRSKPWKKRLLKEIKPLFENVGGLPSFKFDTPADLLKLIPILEGLFIEGIDALLDLMISYSADLEAERVYIEEHASDKQILAAFQGVVRLADPFGVVGLMVRRIGL